MLEFKELAVKRVENGQSFSSVAKERGMNEQTLRSWVAARGSLAMAWFRREPRCAI
jgi:transposase-like protein